MTTLQLMQDFSERHNELSAYIMALPDDDFLHSANGKWSAGQQLAHVVLCLMPLSQALSSPDFIKEKFGALDREPKSYEDIIQLYKASLKNGGKAPERYLPATVNLDERQKIKDDLNNLLVNIPQQFINYTEAELDSLVLPHPLLGKLSIREMFFLMTYHATHHLEQTKRNLE